MASTQTGKFKPWTLIGSFVLLVVILYGLLFFTPGSNSPKLGIDLQGGTRVTLAAATVDGSAPTRESMIQARTIMETRVNGSGVVGAQVQLDGASQLVVTVPGKSQDLSNLARAARLNIRPVVTSVPVAIAAPTATDSSGSSGSGSSGAVTSSPAAPTTAPAIGETQSSPPVIENPDSSGSSSGAPTSDAPSSDSPSSDAASADDSSAAPSSDGASNGLRAGRAAATTPSGSAAPSTGSGAATSGSAETDDSAAASTAAEPSGSGESSADVSGASDSADASATGASGGAPAGPTWPEGSNPQVPTQPQGSTEEEFTAWQTAAATTISSGGLTCADLNNFQGLDDPNKPVLACDEEGGNIFVLEKTLIPGDQITSATAGIDSSGGGWGLNVDFNQTGFNTWSSYTTANVGKLTAFTLDGQVLSAPAINEPITTPGTRVSGSFTQDSATSLANSLKFGALPLQFALDRTENVSAEIGSESLQAGLIAGGIGLLLVVLYCLFYYRLLGVITVLSLVLSGILVYGVMVLLGRWIDLSLDLAGIAGLIIAIGITADSFVVYFERLKDEVREGRTFRSAVPRGWQRAIRTILSADAVTFLSAVILYLLAVGDVKGFAFTLGLSTVLDLVVVFLVTHPLVALAAGSKVFKSPSLSGLGAVAEAGARHRSAAARLAAKEA